MSDIKSTAQPAEYKYQSFVNRWTTLDTQLSLSYKFNIPRKMEKAEINTKILEGVQSYLQDITSSVCTINGDILPDEQLLIPLEKQTKSSHSGTTTPMTVDVYLIKPFIKESSKIKESESCGVLQVVGCFHCKACINQKMTNKDAIQAIKYDAVRSIISRCEVLCDDILDLQEEKPEDTSLESIWTCPRRVFAPLGKTPVTFCDYVFEDEIIKDSLDRMSELLDLNPKEDEVQCLETVPANENIQKIKANLQSRQEVEENSSEEQPNSTSESSGIGSRVIGAVLGLVTALVATGVAFLWGETD